MRRTITGRASTAAVSGAWIRSSRCTPGNNCVELRLRRDVVDVRDSKQVDSEVLNFGRDQWIIFLKSAVR